MSRIRKAALVGLILVNGAIGAAALALPTSAAAEEQMGTGYCALCIAPWGGAAHCCVEGCGGQGQPACACHNATQCGN